MKATLLPALGLSLLLSTVSRSSAESFASWSAKAEKAEKKHDTLSALEAYTNALRLWKKGDGKKPKAKLLAARAALYASSGSPEPALKDFSDAVRLDDKSAPIFYNRGRLELDMGRTSDAVTDFYKAAKLNLGYKEAYFYRGLAYERQGDVKFAREDYKTACRLGLKQACSAGARAKAQEAQAARPAPDAFEAASPPEPVKRSSAEVKKPRRKRAYKLDWQACLDALAACTDGGGAFGDCVKQAPVCEASTAKGCCPHDCVKKFNELVDQGTRAAEEGGQSEASAFREVFGETPSCAKP
ncbi:MAG: hypothetical protein HY077_05100 [Elusimicrobia bacterium]|nr:hypothetical protein [Elusimicrobiota bacterium]